MTDRWNGEQGGYLIHYKTSNTINFTNMAIVTDDNAISYSLTGLEEWTEYDVQVAAFNQVGISDFSNLTSGRTRESGTHKFSLTYL